MKLEDIVTSKELSQKLKDIGISQESIYSWIDYQPTLLVENFPEGIAAFTTSELLEILPSYIEIKSNDQWPEPFNGFWLSLQKRIAINIKFIVSYIGDTCVLDDEQATIIGGKPWEVQIYHKEHDTRDQNALAKMLIYLKENKII